MFRDIEYEEKDKIQVPQRNEMLRLYTALGFVSKNNIIPNKIY